MPLSGAKLVIGRASDDVESSAKDVATRDEQGVPVHRLRLRGAPALSRRHAELECRGGRLYLTDLGSLHGTSRNGWRLPSRATVRLRGGDTVVLAPSAPDGRGVGYTIVAVEPGADGVELLYQRAVVVAPRTGGEGLLSGSAGRNTAMSPTSSASYASLRSTAGPSDERSAASSPKTAAAGVPRGPAVARSTDADSALGTTSGDPLGRKQLGRDVVAWLDAAAAVAAAQFLERFATGAGSTLASRRDFSVGDAMRAALRDIPRPQSRGAASANACTRAASNWPTLWDHFQRAVAAQLEARNQRGDADTAPVPWKQSPEWLALKTLAATPQHREGAAQPRSADSLTGTQRRVEAAKRNALAARVATFCDAAEAQLLAERAAERANFETLREATDAAAAAAEAAGAACELDDRAALLGGTSGPRVLTGMILVATSTSSGRRFLTLQTPGGAPLPPTALSPGDWVVMRADGAVISGSDDGASSMDDARGETPHMLDPMLDAELVDDLGIEEADAVSSDGADERQPSRVAEVEGRVQEVGSHSLVVVLPVSDGTPGGPVPMSAALAACAGRMLVVMAAPDGVTFNRQMAALAKLRLVTKTKGHPAAAVVAALFPEPPPPPVADAQLLYRTSAAIVDDHTHGVHVPSAPPPLAPSSAVGALIALGATSYDSFAASWASLGDLASLDPFQRAAAAAGLARNHSVACIQGPPGTGKTSVIATVVTRAAGRGERVLCAAPTNAAVDALAVRLAAAGLRCVRLGDSSGLSEDVASRMSLDKQVAAALGGSAIGTDSLDALRSELRSARARATAARDGPRAAAAAAALVKLAKSARKAAAQAERDVLRCAQVVLCTCTGAGESVMDSPNVSDFDLVVLDEAGQATQPSAWLPLLRGKRAMLVGDAQQLAPTVLSPAARQAGLAVSLLERAEVLATRLSLPHHMGNPDSAAGAGALAAAASAAVVRTTLRTQYRSHASIAGWASAALYDNMVSSHASCATRQLCSLPGVVDSPLTRTPWVVLTTRTADGALLPGCGEVSAAEAGVTTSGVLGGSVLNSGEADAVATHVASLLAARVPPHRIAVLSPYAAQVSLLRERIAALRVAGAAAVVVASVDAFQGQEADAVVISTVRANATRSVGFLADTRRMNVAITRAKCQVALVVDPVTVGAHPFLGALLQHAVAGSLHGAVCVQDAAAGTAPWDERV